MARKGFKDEARTALVWSLSVNKVIWALRSKKVDESVKIDLARSVLLKMLPQDINLGDAIKQIVQVYLPKELINATNGNGHQVGASQRPSNGISLTNGS